MLVVLLRCIVPQITVLTPILDYGRCFLRHPYEHHVKLQNDTELPAKYELLPQAVDEFACILYTSPQPKVTPSFNDNQTHVTDLQCNLRTFLQATVLLTFQGNAHLAILY